MSVFRLTTPDVRTQNALAAGLLAVVLLSLSGCGTIREQRATNQLLLSDAVDRAVANIDFSPLAYEKVFLDSRYLQFKNDSAVTTNYLISSLRQQMIVAGCLLQEGIAEADYVVEARIGALGSDGHDINYGVPASSTVNAAASLVSGTPPLPVFPEVSLARRTEEMAAVKVAVFAYAKDSRMPVWQSGTSLARSEASGTWILGAGPFKRGSIYDGTQFAGKKKIKLFEKKKESDLLPQDFVYRGTATWDHKLREKTETGAHLNPPDFDQEPAEAEEPEVQVADESSDTPR